jgi:hypothetical protein
VPPEGASALPLPPVSPPLPAPPRARTGGERYRVQFTADQDTYAQLEELRALMRHQIPDGDVGKILSRAIASLLAQVRKQKFAETSVPRAQRAAENPSRHIPAATRREIWQRDAGRCTYVSAGGRRCNAREFIEFDHVEAWADNKAHPVDGITLRCRAHNQLRAQIDFGERHMAQFRRTAPSTGFESSSP